MSEIKVGDLVKVINDKVYADGVPLSDYPGYHEGSLHRVIDISEELQGKMYHLIPESVPSVGAFWFEIEKVQ